MHALVMLAAAFLPGEPAAVDFDTQVVPVLTRAGCNAGACHGAAAGRGGLKLSLWGSNPAADHEALVHQLEGRRVNLADPAKSLLLLKPTAELKHGGGRRLDPYGAGAKLVRAWIEAGAPRTGQRKLHRLEVSPAETVVARSGESVHLRSRAHFDDGAATNVTAWTVFTADDPAAVEVNAAGRATVRRPGQHTVIARFLDRVVAVRIVLPLGATAVKIERETARERHHFIDDEIYTSLETLRLPVSPPADDATFLRRVSLDLTGTLPAPADIRAFVTDTRADKHERLIDRLLASNEFVDYWTHHWGNLLRINSAALGPDGARAFHAWVRDQVARNTPVDRMARTLVTALGDRSRVGPANFARIPGDAREHAEYVSGVFMGVRLRCANCHNHPLDRWTQDDYHGLAAVFARLDRGPAIRVLAEGEVIHPRTGEPAQPRLPGVRFLDPAGDGRATFADWLVRSDNPYFARAVVNRLWKLLMGRGLVEPADDLRETNPATHPRLLDRLARDFVENGHDLRRTLRLIAGSAAYRRSSQTTAANKADDRFYSHALVRPMGAEVLADAIAAVTGVADEYPGFPKGTKAVTLPDSLVPAPSLDILGRCSRRDPCEGSAGSGGLARTLHLINGPLLNRKIAAPQGRLHQMLKADHAGREVIKEFCLRALGRLPTAKEGLFWQEKTRTAQGETERREVFEDFLWALLTCREFGTNH